MHTRRLSGAILIAVGLIISNPLHAQDPPAADCGTLVYSCGSKHVFYEDSEGDRSSAGGAGFHGECKLCENCNMQGQDCYEVPAEHCHPLGCDDGFGHEESAAYPMLLEAGRSGDVRAVINAAEALPSLVTIHHERQAVQIRACNDPARVVASLPLGDFQDLAFTALTLEPRNKGPLVLAPLR